jgi:polysaccharide biosynthesis transport protein
MTLPEILKLARRWWWVLLIAPVIAAGTAYAVSSTMTPMYEAESTAIIEHHMATGVTGDLQSIQAAERRTQTLSQLVTTRSVLEPVIEDLELRRSLTELRDDVSVSPIRETQLVTIAVTDPDPERAAEIADAIASQFATFVQQLQVDSAPAAQSPEIAAILEQVDEQIAEVQEQIDELGAGDGPASETEAEELAELEGVLAQLQGTRTALTDGPDTGDGMGAAGSQVRVVEPAELPTSPVSPRTMLNTALAGFLGLLLGGGIIVGLSWVEDNVATEQDVRALTDRPVIGAVPRIARPGQVEDVHSGRSISGEIFRGIRTNLQFTVVDRDVKSLVVTSVSAGEGKTTVAANLAIVLAQGGQRVILVEADLRRPQVHNLFNRVRNDRGLSNLLLQSPAVIEDVVQSTSINNLKVVTSGPLPPNPPDLFGSSRMRALVSALEDSADIVIFDSPPIGISESLLLSNLSDGILFVVRAGKNRTADVARGLESIAQAGIPVLGVVLNGVQRESQATYRLYQQYYRTADENEPAAPSQQKRGRLSRMFSKGS